MLINNGGYRIIKQRLLAFHNDRNFVGMDFADPTIDFTALARSLGLNATRISSPDELDLLAPAFADLSPKLLEVMVDPAL